MWLFFALLSGLLFTFQGLSTRHLLKGQKDAWAFSFYFSLIGAVVSFPFMLASPKFPTDLLPWLIVIVFGLMVVVHNLLFFKASHYIGPSVTGAIAKLRLAWIFILGAVFLHETASIGKLIGILLTISAGLIIFHQFKKPKSIKGLLQALSATFLNAGIIILLKYLFVYFNTGSLTFFVAFLVPAVLNFIFMPNAIIRIAKTIKEDWTIVLLSCGFGAFANLSMNQGLGMGDASRVIVIIEAFLIFTLVGEHIFLREKEQVWVKVFAVLLAVSGAVLITLSR